MCIASFNFNLNGVEAESVISKQFSVLSALKGSLLTRCFLEVWLKQFNSIDATEFEIYLVTYLRLFLSSLVSFDKAKVSFQVS